jgi:hypothetical protein
MDRLAAMETFVRVIEAGSFSSAAKQLRVGQPAVSKNGRDIVARWKERPGMLGLRFYTNERHPQSWSRAIGALK